MSKNKRETNNSSLNFDSDVFYAEKEYRRKKRQINQKKKNERRNKINKWN